MLSASRTFAPHTEVKVRLDPLSRVAMAGTACTVPSELSELSPGAWGEVHSVRARARASL